MLEALHVHARPTHVRRNLLVPKNDARFRLGSDLSSIRFAHVCEIASWQFQPPSHVSTVCSHRLDSKLVRTPLNWHPNIELLSTKGNMFFLLRGSEATGLGQGNHRLDLGKRLGWLSGGAAIVSGGYHMPDPQWRSLLLQGFPSEETAKNREPLFPPGPVGVWDRNNPV